MRIATYNVNGIDGRLANVLEWLGETKPDVACMQELRTLDDRFPEAAIRAAGYGAVWHGKKSWNGVAILARGGVPTLIRRGLPGDPDHMHTRYIEAAVDGVIVGCLYLPNGDPAPGPKFDYKLRWFERLTEHAAGLRGVVNDAIAIYFLNAALAAAFVSRWCAGSTVEISDGAFQVREDNRREGLSPYRTRRFERAAENPAAAASALHQFNTYAIGGGHIAQQASADSFLQLHREGHALRP